MNEAPIHRRNFLLHLQDRAGYDQPVLLKEPAHEPQTRSHLDQLHNEFAITRQLADVIGVRPAYALEGTESQPVLLLEYIPGQSLTEFIRSTSLDMAEKLRMALNITFVLQRIHDQQVMHKDISSGNILVAKNDQPGSQDGVYLIDFGIASIVRQESVSRLAADDALLGTLAYISPEQTGRMNRQVDYRTDLYSLGVILYELFTGQLPFESGDALEMIHAHIARPPKPLQEVEAGIPGTVSDIILKLLAKNAEDRYQTARSLQIDLKRCLEQWQSNNRIESFALGSDDFTGRLQIPEKLYGRQAEIEQLQAILDQTVTGSTQLLFVAGYSGVGKTALVHEIQKDIIAKQAVFIEGKFDQLQRTLPYSAWGQAFTQLVNYWLAESEASLAGWRKTILEAIGDQGQILIDIIPALEQIIGPQPDAPQLGGIESQNRFNYIFNRFVNGLATPEHPLVVFLDDLQWIDSASLNLIQSLLTIQRTSSLLIIGAYRDNEVGPNHPLTASQEGMRDEGKQVTIITLQDLTPDDTNHLLADALQLTVADCRDLGQALIDKTAGNPFFYRQQLYALESEALLSFDRQRHRWVWAEDVQQSLQAGGNLVNLMVSKIRTLPVETQHILSMAACLGNRFQASTLDSIMGHPQMDILSNLTPALRDGLIVRSNRHFAFVHDRIQEAGYSLIPQADLPKTHLEIGRLLLADVTDEELDEEVFAIVGHLNAGRALIDTDSEKIELARLNLRAGQKAKAAAAFADAKQYIEIGIELLVPNSWQEEYALALSLHNENGELAALTGQYDQVSTTADLIHANAKSILDEMPIYKTIIEAEIAQYNAPEALEIGLGALRDLGVEIPAQPVAEDYQRLNHRLVSLLSDKPLDVVRELPEASDETTISASFILVSIMSAAYIANPSLYPIIAYQGAILTLEHGINVWSAYLLGCVALATISFIDREKAHDEGVTWLLLCRQMQTLALEVQKRPITARSQTRTLETVGVVRPWTGPIDRAIETTQDIFQSGNETGDLLYGGYGAIHFTYQALTAGTRLDAYQRQVIDYTRWMEKMGQTATLQWLSIFAQTAGNFRKILPEPNRLVGVHFDENEWLPNAVAAGDRIGRYYFYMNKLLLSYHFDVDDKLEEYIDGAEAFHAGAIGQIYYGFFFLYASLATLRLFTARSQANMVLVDASLHLMRIWSATAPSTFQHKVDLIEAEKARVTGDTDSALAHYERAISGARNSDFTHEEALANELYARFWAERDNNRFAGPLMREAHSLYLKWGALAKAEHLEKRYPNWLIARSIVVDQPGTKTTTSSGSTTGLDLLTVLKASQDIASEIDLDTLVAKLMTNVIENSGAQQGYLILEQDGQWKIVAEGGVDDTKAYIREAKNISDTDLLAQSIVHYVARTQETVVLDDASQTGEFVNDPYVRSQQARSLLCTPLINQGQTCGILYLENNLAPRVFSAQRVNLLKLLSSQMAISIDNARIHDNLEVVVAERTQELKVAKEDAEESKQNAEEANQAKSIFLANMSHELRTPLNAILGFSRMLAKDQDTTEAQNEKLTIINRSGEHLLSMINDILDLSKIEAGTIELRENPFDLFALIREISVMIQSRATEKGISVATETETVRIQYVKSDVGKLRQILINLLGNAVKFTDEGGVTIRCSNEPIPEEPKHCHIVIEVEDTGSGIEPARLENIFEPFVRGTDEPEQKGTGLGLSICKAYADLMGGTLEVESESGKGSLFRLRLPAQIARAMDVNISADDKPWVIGLASTDKTWRILVADDNRENLLLLKSLLEVVGFFVLEAKNGQEAVAAFKKESPDFIWMDMRMPVMDGYEAVRQIRQCSGGDTVPIIALTASAFREQRDEILAAGCNDMVFKPFQAHEIFETMARCLDIEYIYEAEGEAAPVRVREVELTAVMLANLPAELLQELRGATLSLNREAIYAVIDRIAPLAPDTAKGLRTLLDDFQMGRIRELLGEVKK